MPSSRANGPGRRLAAVVSAVFLLVLSAGAIAAGVGYVRKALAMRGFVSTRATVIDRAVVALPGRGAREGVFGEGGGYAPKVTYRFTVDGQHHTSDKLGYAQRGYKKQLAERRVAEIPNEVEVWFDPRNPNEAYLERHSAGLGWALIAGGGVVVLGVLAWLVA